jgi:hypothetical protein
MQTHRRSPSEHAATDVLRAFRDTQQLFPLHNEMNEPEDDSGQRHRQAVKP